MTTTTTPAPVAWSLHAPSKTGGKAYQILLWDRYCIVGWGKLGGRKQYQAHTLGSETEARAFALEQTSKKEKAGYRLQRQPMTYQDAAEDWAWIGQYARANHRGISARIGSAFNRIFSLGTRLN